MTDDVGDKALCGCRFETKNERYQDILKTTWPQLDKGGLAKFCFGDYYLTVDGWTQGIIWLRRHHDTEFGLGKLMQVLQHQVDPRPDGDAYLKLADAVRLTGLPEERIRNILEGKLIEHGIHRVGARLARDDEIVIPNNFNHELPELQQLEI